MTPDPTYLSAPQASSPRERARPCESSTWLPEREIDCACENYEHPAATILLTAHKDLERLVLSRNELRFKTMVDEAWSELAYMGLVEDPL